MKLKMKSNVNKQCDITSPSFSILQTNTPCKHTSLTANTIFDSSSLAITTCLALAATSQGV